MKLGQTKPHSEDWGDMGSTMTSLVQLAFGVMDIDAWLRNGDCARASLGTVGRCSWLRPTCTALLGRAPSFSWLLVEDSV